MGRQSQNKHRTPRQAARWRAALGLVLCGLVLVGYSRSDKALFWDLSWLSPSGEQPARNKGTPIKVVDIGPGWEHAHTWSKAEKERRCASLARLLKRILDQRPKVIGLDLLVSRHGAARNTCTPPLRGPSPLLDVLRQAPERFVLPMALELPPYITWRGMRWRSTNDGAYLVPQTIRLAWPVARIRATRVRLGVANLLQEGPLLRRALTWMPFPTTGRSEYGDISLFARPQQLPQKLPTFAMELARAAAPQREHPAQPGHVPIQWRYLGEPLSANALRKGSPLGRQLRDAVVLVGALYRPQRDDTFATPVGWRAGLHVQAHIVDTLLHGKPIGAAPLWLALVALLVVGGLAWWLGGLALHPWWLLSLWLALAALGWGGAQAWFSTSHQVVPLHSLWLMMLIGFLIGAGGQLQRQRERMAQLQRQSRAIFEAIHPPPATTAPDALAQMRDTFPQPLAYYCAYLSRATGPSLQMLYAIDLFQLALIYVDVLAVVMLFDTPEQHKGKVRGVLKGQNILGKNPSVGVWWGFYRDLMRRYPQPETMPIAALHRAILDPATNKLTADAHELARELIFYRNRYMHDFRGAAALQREQSQPAAYQARVTGWLHSQLGCLAQYPLFQVLEQQSDGHYQISVLMGDRIEGEPQELQTSQALQRDHLYVQIPTVDRCYCLSPFVLKAPCATHMRDEYFFYTKGFSKDPPHFTGMHSDCVLDWRQEDPAHLRAFKERLAAFREWLTE